MSDRVSQVRTFEVLTATAVSPRRPPRHWSDDEKARLVAEAFSPGSTVAEVARAYELDVSQLYAWRRKALSSGAVAPLAVPLGGRGGSPNDPLKFTRFDAGAGAPVEIVLGDAVVRVGGDIDPDQLTAKVRHSTFDCAPGCSVEAAISLIDGKWKFGRNSMGRLSGRVAVITGGANGIGQAFAKRLAEDGASIALADNSDSTRTGEMVRAAGGRFYSEICDVREPAQVASFAEGVARELGDADILVNNVGIYPLKPFSEISFAEWRQINAINVDSMFLFAQAFVPAMIAKKTGRIVNMTSTVNWLMIPNYVHYITTKAAVIGFTRGLANELGAHNITVNAIAPSLVKNATTEASPLAGTFEAITQLQAIHRLQVPEDLAGTLSFLVSDDAAFVTGQTIAVDGGMTKG